MNKTILQVMLLLSLVIGVAACSTQRPVLASNAHLMRVGGSVAEADIEDCVRRAEGISNERGEAGKESGVAGTVGSGAVGAAAGAAGGAVVGRAGQGAAAGAAGGAAASLTSAILQSLFASKTPDPSYRGSVDRCLRDKGYEPVGWK